MSCESRTRALNEHANLWLARFIRDGGKTDVVRQESSSGWSVDDECLARRPGDQMQINFFGEKKAAIEYQKQIIYVFVTSLS